MFIWFFGYEAYWILAPWPRINPLPPALEGEDFLPLDHQGGPWIHLDVRYLMPTFLTLFSFFFSIFLSGSVVVLLVFSQVVSTDGVLGVKVSESLTILLLPQWMESILETG